MNANISKYCKFAILDFLTKKQKEEINAARKRGCEIHFTMKGRFGDCDWPDWDGKSIGQGVDALEIKIDVMKP